MLALQENLSQKVVGSNPNARNFYIEKATIVCCGIRGIVYVRLLIVSCLKVTEVPKIRLKNETNGTR